jgi:hypothetical protein
MTILETAEVRAMIPAREARPEWVSFYSPDQAVEIRCTEREYEDFERETGVRLGADVIDDQTTFDRLKAYLTEECDLGDPTLACDEDPLRNELDAICRAVAALDDAGLPVQHKSVIQRARNALTGVPRGSRPS